MAANLGCKSEPMPTTVISCPNLSAVLAWRVTDQEN
tara:strand:- start:1004 stop:1111 length:108 start_codon:yes stop_codon:yes gene_type:complete